MHSRPPPPAAGAPPPAAPRKRASAVALRAALLLLFAAPSGVRASFSPAAATFTNPILSLDFPDPTVMRASTGVFFVYATMGNGLHIQVASSPDLVTWTPLGEAIVPPTWLGAAKATWAPDVQQHGDTFYMYFAATGPNATMCIAVMTSSSPAGPFRDARGSPLFCSPSSSPYSALDPKCYDDEATGAILLYFGSGGQPVSVVELAPNRTALAPGAPPPLPLVYPDASQPYEATTVEGAWLHHRAGADAGDFLLLYSGDNCCGAGAKYAVMAARSSTGPRGPFVKLGNATGSGSNVILSEGDAGFFAAPGHNSMLTDDAGAVWIFYHAYRRGDLAGPRMLLMDRVSYDAAGWPVVGEPSSTPQAAPTVTGRSSASLRMLPRLNIVGAVTVSGISSGADLAVQFHVANSDIVNGSAVFAGQAFGCAVMRFDADAQFTCAEVPSGPGCAGMPWGSAPCVGCSPNRTLAYDHCKAQPNITQVARLVAYARAAEAAGDIPPLANLVDDAVFLFRGTLDTVYRDGTLNYTMSTFAGLGVPAAAMRLESSVPAAHSWPTADAAVPRSSCGKSGSPGAPPAMENCGYDGAGAALQHLYGGTLTPPANVSAFDPASLLMFYQFHYYLDAQWAGQGKEGWLFMPATCQGLKPCRLHVALHGCGMSASNPLMGASFYEHTGLNAWAEANDLVVLYPQQGGYIDFNRSAPTPQVGGACFDGYGQTGADYAFSTSPQMLAIRNMVAAITGGR